MTLEKALEWYSHLARQPGWKAYVWDRVQQMAREWPVLYSDLPERLKAAMKEPTSDQPS